jgi:hypothetical protein
MLCAGMKDYEKPPNNEPLFDALGRIVGRVSCRKAISGKHRREISVFLEHLSKQKGKDEDRMSKMDISQKVNMVLLAGIVQIVKRESDRVFFTLDAGMKQWVPCSVYKNPEMWKAFQDVEASDFVQIRGFIQPWSKKDSAGGWDRGLNIEVTEIKGHIRGDRPVTTRKESTPTMSDGLPF